jgi:tight adherence protein B
VSRRALRIGFAVAAVAATVGLVAASSVAAASSQPPLSVTPVQRVPFPQRGYVIDLPQSAALNPSSVRVTENGKVVGNASVTPLAGSGLGFGAMLALDASDSMRGSPYANAITSAQKFVANRGNGEAIGLIAFNGNVLVLQKPTADMPRVRQALANPPQLAQGTRIYDAIERALGLIAKAQLSTASIVLLTDGSDIGSKSSLEQAITRAQKQGVRIFTVGLRSPSFDPGLLRHIANETGGAYTPASSPAQLAQIYASLSSRLAQEYLLEYHSDAAPKSQVNVAISANGFAPYTTSYTAPTLSGLAPYHESLWTRFLQSGFSLFLVALLVAGIIVYVIQTLLRRPQSDLVQRVSAFSGEGAAGAAAVPSSRMSGEKSREWHARRRAAAESARGALGNLERTLEIADIQMSAGWVVVLTILGTIAVIVILALISPIFVVLGLMTPFFSRGLIRRKLKKVRGDFAEQLPSNLQVLASALRSGYSFNAALTTVVEQAQEPSQRELRRVISDDRLGVPMDEALRRVAKRMDSRDLEQVALVAELQVTTGGNVAEVLDVVVGTIRDRQDVRRLIRTLTAQGRMARWILIGLPIVSGLFFYIYEPDIVGAFYSKAVGQVFLVFAAILVAIGAWVVQKVIEIEV